MKTFSIKKITILGLMCAIAVASRYALAFLPNFKPVLAIVVMCGVAYGAVSGAMVGAATMLISNFLFGQGLHTPFQMFAMGLVGFLAGIVFKKIPVRFWTLAIFGGIATFFIYSPIMNFQSMLMMSKEISFEKFLLFEIAGLPFDIAHTSASILFLVSFSSCKTLFFRISRI
jgi:uncharacterized membrane protein